MNEGCNNDFTKDIIQSISPYITNHSSIPSIPFSTFFKYKNTTNIFYQRIRFPSGHNERSLEKELFKIVPFFLWQQYRPPTVQVFIRKAVVVRTTAQRDISGLGSGWGASFYSHPENKVSLCWDMRSAILVWLLWWRADRHPYKIRREFRAIWGWGLSGSNPSPPKKARHYFLWGQHQVGDHVE